jgi:hypothetical protein
MPRKLQQRDRRSQQEGARAFAIGTFQAIRNPAHHLTGDWNPVTAFHHLTALSQIAHWFREWNIERYIPPPPDFGAIRIGTVQSASLMQPVNRSQTPAPIAKPGR